MSGQNDRLTRRTVLRTGVATAAVGIGAAASGSAAAETLDAGGSEEKRGGRAQLDGDARPGDTFTLGDGPSGVARSASCMADESAQQTYLEYTVEFCDSDEEATLYVIPDEAELAGDEVYVFRSVRPCRATDNDLVAFGPARRSEC